MLVVDDDVDLLATVGATLEDGGFDVITRATSFGTSRAVMTHRPDAVLLDVAMPGLGAAGLVPLLSNLARSKPALILYSALDPIELRVLAQDCGAFGAIEKATSPPQLIEQLEAILDRWSRTKGPR